MRTEQPPAESRVAADECDVARLPPEPLGQHYRPRSDLWGAGRYAPPMASVLITGAGRRGGIAAACARTLAAGGWDVGLSCWLPADRESGLPGDDGEPAELAAELRDLGVRAELVEADLADPAAPAQLFDELEGRLGPFTALVASHCRDVELPLLGTSAEEFDRHFAVNARSVALLIQELANRLPGRRRAGGRADQ